MTVITLFCRGQAPAGTRFLDGRTGDGSVGLAPATDGFSGTRWERTMGEGNVWILRCLGDFKSPAHVFLDGRTQDGSVGLAPNTKEPFSGTRWRARDHGNNNFTLECLGDFKNPAFRFLDGHTGTATVGLAPNTNPPFTGTLWNVEEAGQIIDHGTNTVPAEA